MREVCGRQTTLAHFGENQFCPGGEPVVRGQGPVREPLPPGASPQGLTPPGAATPGLWLQGRPQPVPRAPWHMASPISVPPSRDARDHAVARRPSGGTQSRPSVGFWATERRLCGLCALRTPVSL